MLDLAIPICHFPVGYIFFVVIYVINSFNHSEFENFIKLMPNNYKLPEILLLHSPDWEDYELIDSGDGKKLERFGNYQFIRPEHQAMWKPALALDHWKIADAIYKSNGGESGGNWMFQNPIPKSWSIRYRNLHFEVGVSGSRHLGVFPEQAVHWDWITKQINKQVISSSDHKQVRVLNLFGYTGLASLAASTAGAHVTHVDASKKVINWAKRNQVLSGLSDRPIRWLLDDVIKFVQREVRRGSLYEGIILDPPKFGRGPKGQVWEVFESLPDLLAECRKLLSPKPRFILLTTYAIRSSSLSPHYTIQELTKDLGGTTTSGELVLIERSAGRVLSMANFSRWFTE